MSDLQQSQPVAGSMKEKWPKRLLTAIAAVLLVLLLAKACFYVVTPNGGHMFDRYKVLVAVPNPARRVTAVLYEYEYAELSSIGYSNWFIDGDAPPVGSNGMPSGEPGVTLAGSENSLTWKWDSDGVIEIRVPGHTQVITPRWPADCFWDFDVPHLCLHSPKVVFKTDAQ